MPLENVVKCRLDAEGTVCLKHILESFNSSIKEEHAWALCYQCAKCFSQVLNENNLKFCYNVTDVQHVRLHSDGYVHQNTILLGPRHLPSSDRQPLSSEHELVVGLGIVIFNALDMGYSYGVERAISQDLEELIDAMTSVPEDMQSDSRSGGIGGGHETDDEGIERDSGECDDSCDTAGPSHVHSQEIKMTINEVLETCARRISAASNITSRQQQADNHYKAVCRALVAEALELSTFLEKVSSKGAGEMRLDLDQDTCRDLDQLNFHDWSNRRIWRALQARFWVQVIGELRMGVKLKKVNASRTPIEYEMTPYEILMDDIRSRRYNLRKIMVDGDVPQRVKKDAHALILEFIRSRPPLRKVAERKLAPLKKTPTPREELLDSIKRGRKLKPIRSKSKHLLTPAQGDGPKKPVEKDGIPEMKEKPTRRLIKVDFSVLQDDDEDEDDDNVVAERPEPPLRTSNGTCPSVPARASSRDRPKSPKSPPKPAPRTHWTHRTGTPHLHHITQDEYHQFCDAALESYDLATQCPTRRASFRRHTLSTSAALSLDCGAGSRSVPQSRPSSRQSTCSSADLLDSSGIAWSRGSIQDDLMNSTQWHEAMSLDDRLSLTLEEIVHIRSVLTKAELEALPVEGRVKEDVERRKVCFLCLKTRFGIFGPWGQRCRLCKRTVCRRCYTKMRIPTEHFSNVPVVLLSPSLMSSPEEEVKESFPRSLVNRLMPEESTPTHTNSVGSAPSSPSLQRSNIMTCSAPPSRLENYLDQAPSPARSTTSERRAPPRYNKLNSKGVGDKIRGVQMIVCHDCKIMVIQIIRSSRTSRSAIRNNAIRNLTLNISPVY